MPRPYAGNVVRHTEEITQWLARTPREQALEPEMPIIDAHHHLWDVRAVGNRYLLQDLLGSAVQEVLEAQLAAAGGRLRGIRYATPYDASGLINKFISRPVPPHRLTDPAFREGFAQLDRFGLGFDAWLYHPQLPDLLALARAFPETPVIIDHVGTLLGVGPYAGHQQQELQRCRNDLRDLAACPNVSLKIGGLGMPVFGLGLHERELPPSSDELAKAWRPYVEMCIEVFGARRCMFESNFPVDKQSCGYSELWNAFKRLTATCTAAERTDLFSGTAARVYRMASVV